jgi:hypothetical protein
MKERHGEREKLVGSTQREIAEPLAAPQEAVCPIGLLSGYNYINRN